MTLEGARVLVTGALGALGSAITSEFLSQGSRVVIHHLGQAEIAAAAVRDLTEEGHDVMAVDADVTQWREVERLASEVVERWGGIDVLVNNAGYMVPGLVTEMSIEDWTRTIDVDLTGVFMMCRQVVPLMRQGGGGAIVNISSQLAYKGAAGYASYCAAKAGVLGLTRAMARELGPAIRVNAVAPGPIDTPFIEPWKTPEWVSERTSGMVAGRLGAPQEVAPSVVFLAGPGAEFIHGETLHVNGGGVMG